MEVGSISTWLGISATDLQFSTDPPGTANPYWKSNCIKLSAPSKPVGTDVSFHILAKPLSRENLEVKELLFFFGSNSKDSTSCSLSKKRI